MNFSKLVLVCPAALSILISLPLMLQSPVSPSTADDQAAEANQSAVEDELLTIAKEYQEWGPVDAMASWAPLLCRTPLPSDKHHVEFRFSESEDSDTHGQKIYLLYARDRENYRLTGEADAKVGQAIVKQSWKPAESADADQTEEGRAELVERLTGQGFPAKYSIEVDGKTQEFPVSPFVHKGRSTYHADQIDSLFIMFKTDPDDESTDNGWVYGTVSADGKTVTSSGRIESCMACHVDAGDDRLFGLPSLLRRRR